MGARFGAEGMENSLCSPRSPRFVPAAAGCGRLRQYLKIATFFGRFARPVSDITGGVACWEPAGADNGRGGSTPAPKRIAHTAACWFSGQL